MAKNSIPDIKIYVSDECNVCQEVKNQFQSKGVTKDITYIDINSPEAIKKGIKEVPTVFVNEMKCRLMQEEENGEIFIRCPE